MIEKISTLLTNVSPDLMTRIAARSGLSGAPDAEIRKLLGEPIPKTIDPKDLPRELAALFATYGMLQQIKKKLEWISRHKGNKIIPAKNTIACVDAEDNIYMGVDFLEQFKENGDLIAGIMAHEWGHMVSELTPGMDLSHMSWDQLFEVRREEEANADAFAGRALYMMNSKMEEMVKFLKQIEEIDKKVGNKKYHDAATRAAIIRGAYEAQKRANETVKKLFSTQPTSKLIAIA